MKKIIFLLLVFAGFKGAIAQEFNYELDVKYSDFTSDAKRKLAVELLDEDARAVNKLTKAKSDYPRGVENYQKFVKAYNENIQKAVAKYWTLNTQIEYKTTKEIKKLLDARDKDYVILSPFELGGDEEFITRFYGTVVCLKLFKAEKADKVDYKIVLPYAFSRKDQNNPLTDYYFTIQTAAANIQYMLDKKKTSHLNDYIETQAIANCKNLKDKTLMLEPDLMTANIDKKEIKEYYKKKFEILKDATLVQSAIEGTDESKCYVVLIPYSTYKNPFDRRAKTYLLCYKMIVNASDGKILNYMEGKAKSGDDLELVQVKDFKSLDSCDK